MDELINEKRMQRELNNEQTVYWAKEIQNSHIYW
jgi:hypothetical protein